MTATSIRAALVALIAALALSGCGSSADDSSDSSDTDSATAQGTTSTAEERVELNAPAAAASGRCMAPSAEVLGQASVAFDGTVSEMDGSQVTLDVGRWYAGEAGETVTVIAPSEDMQALIGAVAFELGGRFLAAGDGDDTLMVCGMSAAYTPELEALYAEAFPASS